MKPHTPWTAAHLVFLTFEEKEPTFLSGVAYLNKLTGVEVLSFGKLA